ncbi:UNVERIFIED_CONTAM: hypothetical protein RKD43_005401 [Streptomyces graminofaciens]
MAAAANERRTGNAAESGRSPVPSASMATMWPVYTVSAIDPTALTGVATHRRRADRPVPMRQAATTARATPVLATRDSVVWLCGAATSSHAGMPGTGFAPTASDHQADAAVPVAEASRTPSSAPGTRRRASHDPPYPLTASTPPSSPTLPTTPGRRRSSLATAIPVTM